MKWFIVARSLRYHQLLRNVFVLIHKNQPAHWDPTRVPRSGPPSLKTLEPGCKTIISLNTNNLTMCYWRNNNTRLPYTEPDILLVEHEALLCCARSFLWLLPFSRWIITDSLKQLLAALQFLWDLATEPHSYRGGWGIVIHTLLICCCRDFYCFSRYLWSRFSIWSSEKVKHEDAMVSGGSCSSEGHTPATCFLY